MPPTPTDYPHTPEPWNYIDEREGTALAFRISSAKGSDAVAYVVGYLDYEGYDDVTPANATRIVTCVNACAGLTDPAADIARLRKIAAWACALVADIDGGDSVNLTDALDTVRPLLSFEGD